MQKVIKTYGQRGKDSAMKEMKTLTLKIFFGEIDYDSIIGATIDNVCDNEAQW